MPLLQESFKVPVSKIELTVSSSQIYTTSYFHLLNENSQSFKLNIEWEFFVYLTNKHMNVHEYTKVSIKLKGRIIDAIRKATQM